MSVLSRPVCVCAHWSCNESERSVCPSFGRSHLVEGEQCTREQSASISSPVGARCSALVLLCSCCGGGIGRGDEAISTQQKHRANRARYSGGSRRSQAEAACIGRQHARFASALPQLSSFALLDSTVPQQGEKSDECTRMADGRTRKSNELKRTLRCVQRRKRKAESVKEWVSVRAAEWRCVHSTVSSSVCAALNVSAGALQKGQRMCWRE